MPLPFPSLNPPTHRNVAASLDTFFRVHTVLALQDNRLVPLPMKPEDHDTFYAWFATVPRKKMRSAVMEVGSSEIKSPLSIEYSAKGKIERTDVERNRPPGQEAWFRQMQKYAALDPDAPCSPEELADYSRWLEQCNALQLARIPSLPPEVQTPPPLKPDAPAFLMSLFDRTHQSNTILDSALETRQIYLVASAIRRAGGDVRFIDTEKNLDRDQEIYPRDRGLLVGNSFYSGGFFDRARKHIPVRLDSIVPETLRDNTLLPDFKEVTIKHFFLGGQALYDSERNVILMGIPNWAGGERRRAIELINAQALEQETGLKLLRLDLPYSRYYHIDTALSLLPGGKMLVYPQAFSAESYQNLLTTLGRDPADIIEMKEGDAAQLAANLVSVGNTLVMPAASVPLRETLQQHGFSVITAEDMGPGESFVTELNAGPHCLTTEIPSPKPLLPAAGPESSTSVPSFMGDANPAVSRKPGVKRIPPR